MRTLFLLLCKHSTKQAFFSSLSSRLLSSESTSLGHTFRKISSFAHPKSSLNRPSSAAFATMATNDQNVNHRIQVLSSNIEKPELDDRSYRLIRLLDNKLEALLVHDPKTDKSSAAMDVHVGHLSDPKDFPGLAHALEHCLFLGVSFAFTCLICHRHQEVPRRKRLSEVSRRTQRQFKRVYR
jgi:hypothetical protein